MKTICPLIFLLFCFNFPAKSQQPANPGFEDWTLQILYDEPDSFLSTNNWVYSSTTGGNVIKVTDSYHGSFAAQLTTVQTPTDTMFGGLFIGTPGNQSITGGLPYTDQPDSISGYIKYNIQPNDTSFLIFGFKNNGVVLASSMIFFTGVQNTYTRFSLPLNLPVSPAPDTLFAIISSSRLDPPRYPGSTITIDSISMIGASQPFPNFSFENWTTMNIVEPDNWATINSGKINIPSATNSTNSYSGNYALRLETIGTIWGDTMGFITNGYFGSNGPAGGMPVSSNPLRVTGYYQYFPVGPDTALAAAFVYINSVLIDSTIIRLSAQSTYTYFEIPLAYNGWPYIDTLNIMFSSSNTIDSTAFWGLGSVLLVDELTVVYNPLSIGSHFLNEDQKLGPNPFSDFTILALSPPGNSELCHDFLVYNHLGNIVMKKENIISNSFIVNRDNLTPGIYEYLVIDCGSNNILSKGNFIIQ